MSSALEGVLVLDHTMWQAGPVAATALADLGANVLKIEEPRSGDVGRYLRVGEGDFALGEDHSYYFEMNNRGKRSVALDLKSESGREAFCRLVAKADVYVTNLQLGSLATLQADYETLSKINPRLIYASNTGYGAKGPKAGSALMDAGATALGGFLSVSGYGDDPQNISSIADQSGALMLVCGIMVALYHRERTGVGQRIDASLLGTQAWLGSFYLQRYLFDGYLPTRAKHHEQGGNPMYTQYLTADSRWITMSSVQYDQYWESFCEALGRNDIAMDPRFADLQGRQENSKELITILEGVFASLSAAEWMERFAAYDFPYGMVRTYDEVAEDPQLYINDCIVHFEDEIAGPTRRVVLPVSFSETPVQVRKSAPALGQHTEECLIEFADYDWESLGKLRGQESAADDSGNGGTMRTTVSDGKKVVEIETAKCVGCYLCQMACSFTKHKEFNRDRSYVAVRRVGPWEDEWEVQFTDDCDACGYCANFCEYDALSLRRLARAT
jgi:crotonobetainyl-CoA:carnitine CoA-transferase CaiB-like acyl-CoA transferase